MKKIILGIALGIIGTTGIAYASQPFVSAFVEGERYTLTTTEYHYATGSLQKITDTDAGVVCYVLSGKNGSLPSALSCVQVH